MSDNIISSLIAAAVALLTGGCGWWAGHTLRREGAVDRNLGLQLQGWKDFAATLSTEVRELRERIEDCERDRVNLWRQLTQRDVNTEGDA